MYNAADTLSTPCIRYFQGQFLLLVDQHVECPIAVMCAIAGVHWWKREPHKRVCEPRLVCGLAKNVSLTSLATRLRASQRVCEPRKQLGNVFARLVASLVNPNHCEPRKRAAWLANERAN